MMARNEDLGPSDTPPGSVLKWRIRDQFSLLRGIPGQEISLCPLYPSNTAHSVSLLLGEPAPPRVPHGS